MKHLLSTCMLGQERWKWCAFLYYLGCVLLYANKIIFVAFWIYVIVLFSYSFLYCRYKNYGNNMNLFRIIRVYVILYFWDKYIWCFFNFMLIVNEHNRYLVKEHITRWFLCAHLSHLHALVLSSLNNVL